MGLSDLGYLDQQERRAVPKGLSRLQVKTRDDRDEDGAEDRWRKSVRKRDKMHCRWCDCRVVLTLALVANRAECHHVSGRIVKAIRWHIKNGLLLCKTCHERVTGRVNERFLIVSNHTFTVEGVQYIDASKPVSFRRIA